MTTVLATESGHYYTRTGEPAYTIIGANGKERNTTIRDARRLGLVPSVTEILKMLPKPALDLWKMKNVLMASLTIPRRTLEPDEVLITRIFSDAQEQVRKAAEKGTAIHGAIERTFQKLPIEPEYEPYAMGAMKAVGVFLGRTDYHDFCSAEKSFAHPFGFGGKVDLHSRELNFVLDFKTKEFEDPDKIQAWDEHKIQLSAYRRGLDMPERTRLLNVFISTNTPGLVKIVEHDFNEEQHFFDIFMSLLHTWKLVKKYETH